MGEKNIQELGKEFYFDLFKRMLEKDREKLRIYYSKEYPTVSLCMKQRMVCGSLISG